jgi:hypothetical protein
MRGKVRADTLARAIFEESRAFAISLAHPSTVAQ